jgi:structural maintenance of chromosome 3 (chondroitin sulfate proteoglycan 6)
VPQVNRKLQGYSQVNKKALDQYVSFTEQYDDLLNKKKESDNGAERITELIQALDRKKDEAIERTFKGVAKHFAQVFSELVPDGKGVLVMQRAKDVQEMGRIAAYTGVAIKVAFTRGGETQHMQHLSGGQKSLVALALIFAIQRCDPAPFYLFDEIDSALDQSHRTVFGPLLPYVACVTASNLPLG